LIKAIVFFRFKINETSGEIVLNGELDRESVDQYYLTAEARDGGGLTTFTNLEVKVLDVNDHKPMFKRDEYYVTVREDSMNFLRGDLIVEVMCSTLIITNQDLSASSKFFLFFAIFTAAVSKCHLLIKAYVLGNVMAFSDI